MDPQRILDDLPMRPLQVIAVVMCVALNALDGFDVLAISFASPGIAAEWGISRTELGVVLTMELVGMAVGSILLGNFADGLGRRPVILGCLVIMSLGMYVASLVTGVYQLLGVRFITGIGIGGMLAAINAMVAEYSNAKHRNFNVVIMATGYPFGIIVGGSIASMLLAYFDWRSVFILGAVMTASMIPLVWFWMPESISYLAHQNKPDALQRINAILKRMGHAAIERLPASDHVAEKTSWRDLFSPQLARTTALLTLAYLTHIMTFYYIIKWIPKLVVDMDFTASSAGGVLVWANVGGAVGSVLLGLLTHKVKIRVLGMIAMAGSVVMINVFGMGQADLFGLSLVAAMAGFFTNSAVVALYALFAETFPTHLRAGGTGFVIGVGRAGSVVGPIIAGVMFDSGIGLSGVSLAMAMGSLIGFFALLFLRERKAIS